METAIIEFICWYFKTSISVVILVDNLKETPEAILQENMFPPRFITSTPNFLSANFIKNSGVSNDYLMVYTKVSSEMIHPIISNIKINSRFLLLRSNSSKEPNHSDEKFFKVMNETMYKKFVILDYGDNLTYITLYDIFKRESRIFNMTNYYEISKLFDRKNYFKTVVESTLFESIPNVIQENDNFYGMDPWVMKTIESTLNATIKHHIPNNRDSFGKMLNNGTAIGSIGELYYKTIDICFNQIFLKDYNVSNLQFTNYIFSDSLCIVIPSAGKEPKWKVIFNCFTLSIWLLMIITYIFSSITLVLLRKVKSLKTNSKLLKSQHAFQSKMGLAFSDIWQIFFNAPTEKMTSNTGLERFFIGVLLVYVLVVNQTSFQSVLVTVLTKPKSLPQIDTLDDLAKSGILIKTTSSSLMDVFDSSRPTMKILKKNLKLIETRDAGNIKGRLSRKMKNDFMKTLSLKANGSYSGHMVKECPQQYILSYLMRKDSPYYEDFTLLISRIVNSGLASKWYKDTLVNATLNVQAMNMGDEERQPRSLMIKDLQSSFYILMIGLMTGTVIFLLELGVFKSNL